MSEDEKKARFGYRKKRKRWIAIQTVLLVIVIVAALFSAVLATLLNKTYYVNYSEKSSIDYGVLLKENDFYEDSYLGGDYAYIASLIDKLQAKFNYKIEMQSSNPVDFEYTYRVDAVIQIKEKMGGKLLFAPVYNEIASQKNSVSGKNVSINQSVMVDYQKYNKIAESFISTYQLDGTDASLMLAMYVDVVGVSDEFSADKNKNSYVSSISIPLTTRTVEVKITSDIPKEEQKILSFTTEDIANKFSSLALLLTAVGAALAFILLAYTYLSRNVDVTYDGKVYRLLRNYKSFIQKIRNSFDVSGYQILVVDTFDEMLEIRDTIQSPILMDENADRTCTKFIIPTNTKLLYLYEIKVDDYDEIYGVLDSNKNIEEAKENSSEGDVKAVREEEKVIPAVATKSSECDFEIVEISEKEAAALNECVDVQNSDVESLAAPVANSTKYGEPEAKQMKKTVFAPAPASNQSIEKKAPLKQKADTGVKKVSVASDTRIVATPKKATRTAVEAKKQFVISEKIENFDGDDDSVITMLFY